LYREYTDLSRRHDAEVDARQRQQASNVTWLSRATDTATAAAAGDNDVSTTSEQLSRMVRSFLLINYFIC